MLPGAGRFNIEAFKRLVCSERTTGKVLEASSRSAPYNLSQVTAARYRVVVLAGLAR